MTEADLHELRRWWMWQIGAILKGDKTASECHRMEWRVEEVEHWSLDRCRPCCIESQTTLSSFGPVVLLFAPMINASVAGQLPVELSNSERPRAGSFLKSPFRIGSEGGWLSILHSLEALKGMASASQNAGKTRIKAYQPRSLKFQLQGEWGTSANLQKTFRSLYQLVPVCTSWYKPEKLGKLQEWKPGRKIHKWYLKILAEVKEGWLN